MDGSQQPVIMWQTLSIIFTLCGLDLKPLCAQTKKNQQWNCIGQQWQWFYSTAIKNNIYGKLHSFAIYICNKLPGYTMREIIGFLMKIFISYDSTMYHIKFRRNIVRPFWF